MGDIIRCPVHGIPDCSPLLNGCSIPAQIRKDQEQRDIPVCGCDAVGYTHHPSCPVRGYVAAIAAQRDTAAARLAAAVDVCDLIRRTYKRNSFGSGQLDAAARIAAALAGEDADV